MSQPKLPIIIAEVIKLKLAPLTGELKLGFALEIAEAILVAIRNPPNETVEKAMGLHGWSTTTLGIWQAMIDASFDN